MTKRFAGIGLAALALLTAPVWAVSPEPESEGGSPAPTTEEVRMVDFQVGGANVPMTEARFKRTMEVLTAQEIESLRNAPIPANWGDPTVLVGETRPDGTIVYSDPEGVMRSVMFAVPQKDGSMKAVCVTNPVELNVLLLEWVDNRAALAAAAAEVDQ